MDKIGVMAETRSTSPESVDCQNLEETLSGTSSSDEISNISEPNYRVYDTLVILDFAFCILLLILCVYWLNSRGGLILSSATATNVHIFLALFGAFVLYPIGSLVYRFFRKVPKIILKIFHSVIMTTVCIQFSSLIRIMYQAKSSSNNPHFVSVHSWIAVFLTVLMFVQLLGGIISFVLPLLSPAMKQLAVIVHRIIGKYFFIFFAVTVALGLGRMQNYAGNELNKQNILINVISILAILISLLSLYILNADEYKRKTNS